MLLAWSVWICSVPRTPVFLRPSSPMTWISEHMRNRRQEAIRCLSRSMLGIPTRIVPKRVRNISLQHDSQTSEATRRVAEVLSVLGESADWNLLSKVSGTSLENLRKSVYHLEHLGLVKA